MQHSAYDFADLCLLSAALSVALALVRKSAGGPLTEIETSDFSERPVPWNQSAPGEFG